MLKLPIRDLEEARANPLQYHAKLIGGNSETQMRYGFANAIRDAIHRFHTSGDSLASRSYLIGQLGRFRNQRRIAETIDSFDWYVVASQQQGWPCFKSRLKIKLAVPERVGHLIECTGQIDRVDIVPTGGFAGWLIKNTELDGWSAQLRMPLMQKAIASELAVDISEVSIGIYSLKDNDCEFRRFSRQSISEAERQLDSLLLSFGL